MLLQTTSPTVYQFHYRVYSAEGTMDLYSDQKQYFVYGDRQSGLWGPRGILSQALMEGLVLDADLAQWRENALLMGSLRRPLSMFLLSAHLGQEREEQH